MNSQKRENLLNLSLDVTEEEREKSMELGVGVDEASSQWEVIVRYSGDLSRYEELGINQVELLGGYAILTVSRDQLDLLSQIPEIAYIEKPKRLFFELDRGVRASCIVPLQAAVLPGDNSLRLFGNGCLVAVVDSGIDYYHPDFRNEDGTTRILRIWDQTLTASEDRHAPEGYRLGVEFTREQINEALQSRNREEGLALVPVTDESGHGTAVAGIAAGNGRASGGRYRGVAPQSTLLIVKLGRPREQGFPRTTELMQAVDYAVRLAAERNMPLAVNISIGNTYGSHDGTALLESYLNTAADVGRSVIVTGTGNEGAAHGHTSAKITTGQSHLVEFTVGTYESKLNIQLWKYYVDEIVLELVTPSGQRIGPFEQRLGTQRFRVGQTEFLLFYGEPAPYTRAQEIYLDMIPAAGASYLNSGVYGIRLLAGRILEGEYHFWMPSSGALNRNTGFLLPTPDITLTIPSTAAKLISVGAYDPARNAFSEFSGRGFTRVVPMVKPELIAPGAGIMAPAPFGGYSARTGTSFATPFVTGAAALLMEYGVVNGNDPYLYGEKVKAYLIRGAKPLPGFDVYPNPLTGYGTLCVQDSLPDI